MRKLVVRYILSKAVSLMLVGTASGLFCSHTCTRDHYDMVIVKRRGFIVSATTDGFIATGMSGDLRYRKAIKSPLDKITVEAYN